MTVHWLVVILALVVLAPQMPIRGSVRRFLQSRRNPSVSTHLLFKCWQNWVDLVRGGVGAYLLSELAFDLDPQIKGAGVKALMLQGSVLGLGMIVQMVRLNNGIRLTAPVFLLTGVTLVYGGWASGGFAAFVGWMFAVGGKSPVYQLPAMGVALAGAGYLLGLSLDLIMNCGFIFLPLIISFIFRQPLAFITEEPPSLPR